MAQPYVGEIRMFAGNFAPAGWMFCDGQLVSISENEALFQLIGTTYGGDGQSTFALPDLRGRLPVHQGSGFLMGQAGGVEEVSLTTAQLPAHSHSFLASSDTAGASSPANNVVGQVGATQIYREVPPGAQMAPQTTNFIGGSQPHSNMQPYLCVDFIISLFGLFPSPT